MGNLGVVAVAVTDGMPMFETTDLPVERISQLCGMGTAGNLRHHFIRAVGVTPMLYRRSFQR
ncbi:AraC family transcriptional regulator [Nocardia salmonicida]|uniref:AraC family transcriptional regulator n=1 Tax=Nocardia salmonicida TaxID=53431 RepID=UPI0007A4D973|nr:AraC family transcriptional regulator [Nocardia salmonicida]